MAEVSLNNIAKSFVRADKDKDGVLSKKEIATEAVKLNSEGKTDEFRLWGTFLVGGSDKAGLFPDFFGANGRTGTDGFVSLGDLANLAAADGATSTGSVDSISSEDFRTKFGSRATDGVTIDIDAVKTIANAGSSSSTDTLELLKKLLPLLLLFSGGGFGGNSQQYGGYGQQQQQGFNPMSLISLLTGSGDDASSNPFAALLGDSLGL